MPKGIYIRKVNNGFKKGHKDLNPMRIGSFKKGHIPVAPFKKGEHSSPATEFKKGIHPKTELKKGQKNNNWNGWKKGQKGYWSGKKRKSGPESANWRGGTTTESQKIRASLEYTLWRKSVFERDSFTCRKTGIKGGKLIAHHINNFADFIELRLAIDNGITLSEKAHKEFHSIYGVKNNTKEQLEEFLNN